MAAKFKCNLCGFESEDAITFASHILSAHTEYGEKQAVETPQSKPKMDFWECELCSAKFLTPEELEDHYKKEHPKEYEEAVKALEEMVKEKEKEEVNESGVPTDRGEPKKGKGKAKKTA